MDRRWKRAVPAALAIAVAVAAAAAYATNALSGGAAGVIVGCAKNGDGDLRIVGDAAQCGRREHEIEFQAPLPPREPQFVTVDCASGDKVNDALSRSDPTEPLTITIKGTCTEAVFVGRDDVTLDADSAGGGIVAPPGAFSALSLNGAHRVNLGPLTLSGGNTVLLASNGSSVFGSGLHVTGGTNTGIAVDLGASAQIHDSTVDGNSTGIAAFTGGSASVSGGTVTNSGTFGVSADGGALRLDGGLVVDHSGIDGVFIAHGAAAEIGDRVTVEHSGAAGVFAYVGGSAQLFGDGVVIDHNDHGVAASAGGALEVHGAAISDNAGTGVQASNNGSVQLFGAHVQNNGGDGVDVSVGSSVTIDHTTISGNHRNGIGIFSMGIAQFFGPDPGSNTVTGNGGFGVLCQSAPAVTMITGPVGVVTGNASGGVSCPSV